MLSLNVKWWHRFRYFFAKSKCLILKLYFKKSYLPIKKNWFHSLHKCHSNIDHQRSLYQTLFLKSAENLHASSGCRVSGISPNRAPWREVGEEGHVVTPASAHTTVIGCGPWRRLLSLIHRFSLHIWARAESVFFSSTGTWPVSLSEFGFFSPTSAMLRVVVESASGIPKKKLGNPDPFATLVFRGKKCGGFVCLFFMFPKRNVCVCPLQFWGLFLLHAAVSVLRI